MVSHKSPYIVLSLGWQEYLFISQKPCIIRNGHSELILVAMKLLIYGRLKYRYQ